MAGITAMGILPADRQVPAIGPSTLLQTHQQCRRSHGRGTRRIRRGASTPRSLQRTPLVGPLLALLLARQAVSRVNGTGASSAAGRASRAQRATAAVPGMARAAVIPGGEPYNVAALCDSQPVQTITHANPHFIARPTSCTTNLPNNQLLGNDVCHHVLALLPVGLFGLS